MSHKIKKYLFSPIKKVRSCLSKVKGGQLALLARPATVVSLIISDVINDPLEIISSGPTCTSFFHEASLTTRLARSLDIVRKYNLESELPQPVMAYLQQQPQGLHQHPSILPTPRVHNYLIFNNRQATDLILAEAARHHHFDYRRVLTNSLCGEAKIVGYSYACLAFGLVKAKRHAPAQLDMVECVQQALENLNVLETSQLKECLKILIGKKHANLTMK